MKKIHILLIEDNRLLRERFTIILKGQPDLKVLASPSNSNAVHKSEKVEAHRCFMNPMPT